MKCEKLYFPIFIDLHGRDILVTGGGHIATRRIRTLLPFTDTIRVVAAKPGEELKELCGESEKIVLEERPYREEDLDGAYMVLACTDDRELNGNIARLCRQRGILVNDCSDRRECDFYFPGIVRKDSVVTGISASGEDHRKAAEIRRKIEELLN